MKKINPISSREYSQYFVHKFHSYLAGKKSNWNFEINLIIKSAIKWGTGKKILDVGCGTGSLLFCFQKLGYNCHGLDFDPIQIDVAKESSENMTNISFRQGSMEDSYFSDSQFDITTSKDLVEHLPDSILKKYLQLSHSCLKKGGLLLIFTKPTKYSYIFNKKNIFYLAPFLFLNQWRLKFVLQKLDSFLPILYKKITNKNMKDTWQTDPPGHCNCQDLSDLEQKIKDSDFEIIKSKVFFQPHQKYFKLVHKFFPYDFVKPNIFVIAQKL